MALADGPDLRELAGHGVVGRTEPAGEGAHNRREFGVKLLLIYCAPNTDQRVDEISEGLTPAPFFRCVTDSQASGE